MDKADLKNKIRGFIMSNGQTIDSVAQLISAKFNRPESLQNLSQKLTRGSIKFSEVVDIADVLGYNVEFVVKK
jgi:hypothetical protein